MSCTDATDCTAVGNDDNDQPIYATAPSASTTLASVTGSTVLGGGDGERHLDGDGHERRAHAHRRPGGVDFYACHVSNSGTLDPQLCPTANGTLYDDSEILSGSNSTASATSSSFTPTAVARGASAPPTAVTTTTRVLPTTSPARPTRRVCAHHPGNLDDLHEPTVSSFTLGQSNTDKAVVTGNAAGSSPTGTVSFYECGPTASAQACTSIGNPVGSAVALGRAGEHFECYFCLLHADGHGVLVLRGYYSGNSNYWASSTRAPSSASMSPRPSPPSQSSVPSRAMRAKGHHQRNQPLGCHGREVQRRNAVIITDTANKITTKVPAQAKTGFVTVTTTGGTVKSAKKFKVT